MELNRNDTVISFRYCSVPFQLVSFFKPLMPTAFTVPTFILNLASNAAHHGANKVLTILCHA